MRGKALLYGIATGAGTLAWLIPAVPAQAAVPAGQADLSTFFNNVGVSSPTNITAGNFDGTGKSYSAEELQYAPKLPNGTGTSLTPGGSFTHAGLTFTWPAPAGTGTADNVIATGQTVPVSGKGNELGVIGASEYGASSGDLLINYTDGSQDDQPIAFNDWWAANGASGSDVVASTPVFLANNGTSLAQDPQSVDVYAVVVPVDPTKTVASVTLPQAGSAPVASGSAMMHIFALSIGSSAAAGAASTAVGLRR